MKKNKLTVIGIVLGMIGGYLYWLFIGCSTGSCPITSSFWSSSLYGGLMGAFFFNLFQKEEKKDSLCEKEDDFGSKSEKDA